MSSWSERLLFKALFVCVIVFLINQALSIALTVVTLFQDDLLINFVRRYLSK